jgi:ketosteroid isomerase-like protein
MSEQQNVRTVQQVYDAFGRGDVAFIVGQLTDDVRWVTHLDAVVPWSGDFSGKANVPRFFGAIADSVVTEAFEPGEFVAQGDTVVSMGIYGCRVRGTGKSARTAWVFIWKFRDGRISSYEQFHDPAIVEVFR